MLRAGLKREFILGLYQVPKSDGALRARLVARGHERAQHFSWERSVRAIHAGYMRALGVAAPVVVATAGAASNKQ